MIDIEELTDAVARTLWLCAYADAIEDTDTPLSGPRPGPGEDWDDYAPATPQEAKAKAQEILSGMPFISAGATCWMRDTGRDLDRFGHCLALQSLGHGVGLGDDYPASALQEAYRVELPYVEFHISQVDLSKVDLD